MKLNLQKEDEPGDEHHVLVEDRLEGVGVQLEVLDGGQPRRLQVVEQPDHVLQARVGHADARPPNLLKFKFIFMS